MNKEYLKELEKLNKKYGIDPPNPKEFREEMVDYLKRADLTVNEDEIPFDIEKTAVLSQQIHVVSIMLDLEPHEFKEGVSWILGDVIS